MNVILFIVLFYYQAISVLVPVSQVCDFIDEEVLIIDVRTPEEFEQGALQNAKNISVSSLEFSLLSFSLFC